MAEAKNQKYQIIIVGVKDHKTREKIEKWKWKVPHHIEGWTKHIETFMAASDLLLTKAGGATTAECLQLGIPTFICNVIPGQEEGNATFLKKNKACIIGNKYSVEKAVSVIQQLTLKNAMYREISKSCKKFKNKNESYKIGKMIQEMLC